MHLSWRTASCGSPPARMGAVAVTTECVDDEQQQRQQRQRSCLSSSSSAAASSSPCRSSTRGAWGDDLVVVHGGLCSRRYALGDTWVLTSTSASEAAAAEAEGEGEATGGWVLSPPPSSSSSTSSPRPPPRAFHCGAVLGACLFVFGGHALEEGSEGEGEKEGGGDEKEQQRRKNNRSKKGEKSQIRKRRDLWKLNLLTMTWEEVKRGASSDGAWPCARDFAAMCSLPPSPSPASKSSGRRGSGGDGKKDDDDDDDDGEEDEGTLLLHGGLDASGERLGDTWMFSVSSSRWTRVCRGGTVVGQSGKNGSATAAAAAATAAAASSSSSSLLAPPRPLPRFGATLTRVRDKAFLVGGDTGAAAAGGDAAAELWSFVSSAARAAAGKKKKKKKSSGDCGEDDDDDGGDDDDDEDSPPAWVRLDLPGAPQARKGHAAAAIGDWLVVTGGRRVGGGGERGRSGNGRGGVSVVGGGRWRGKPAASKESPPPEGDLFADVSVLDCGSGGGGGGSGGGGGHFRWRRASGGLGFGGSGSDESDESDDDGGGDDEGSGTRPPSLRREFASLVALPAVDQGSLLLLGGGDGSGALCTSLPSLGGDCRARIATTSSAAFGPRSPPPPPPPLLGPVLALSGSFSGRGGGGSGGGSSSRMRRRRRLAFGGVDDDGSGTLTPGSDGAEGPGTPVSPSSSGDARAKESAAVVVGVGGGVEERMKALRSRLGCVASPSSSFTSLSTLGDKKTADVAALCAKKTEELTVRDLKTLLSALEQQQQQKNKKKKGRNGRRQQEDTDDNGINNDDGDEKRTNQELLRSVTSVEELRIGQAEALKAAAAALCL